MLAALACVAAVVVFDEETPLELIREIRPRTLVKGADYALDQVVGRDLVMADGGEVVLVPLLPGHSTRRAGGGAPRLPAGPLSAAAVASGAEALEARAPARAGTRPGACPGCGSSRSAMWPCSSKGCPP